MPTGRPSWFRCYACNRKYGGLSRIPGHLVDGVKRTGRTKPTPAGKRGRGAMRIMYEYACPCGHSGWTSHRDVMRFPWPGPASPARSPSE